MKTGRRKQIKKSKQNKTKKILPAYREWRSEWEEEYEKNRKNGRFIREDGIC